MQAAIINEKTNEVENTIVLGGRWRAPQGFYLIVTDIASIGDYYDEATGEFIKPTIDQTENLGDTETK